ncbi:endonuclease V isoform X1 [Cynara cardunculus var. scolymus]|uniref:Endonuclease V n=2 Tax=Cynara cardunculus var. scolymus TaxID=59895 RepID=A0A124SBR0_CYNCS|nr:endonuclease V isoform X1 [Cynara cardunculus var. scolymus]XP_024996201.1 endonuclease V isoform X1 [Cynara cardunculus var. scolymus]XP_024996202.1 endonuclease V isoform X1 [Cynara cardunculus var. scolymus]KVH91432.1 Endonuclease V [Cynara cardunculus var. scolymus]
MERKSKLESLSSASSSVFHLSDQVYNKWLRAQDSLKKKLVAEDDYTWKLGDAEEICGVELLKYLGGVDISFSKVDPSVACGTLVVLDFKTLDVVYEDSSIVKIDVPYVPGFLGFREAPIFLGLLEKMRNGSHPFYPQLLMIDGNGILHPRGFGSACHLGVVANLPTIGIGKNLHHVDGLTKSRVRELLEAEENVNIDFTSLIGDSGNILGVALHSSKGSFKPIYVSIGHRISLASAVDVVKRTCKYRVPEPIRQADIRSRDYLQKHH